MMTTYMKNPDKLFGRLGNRLFQMAYIYSQVKRGNLNDIYCQDFMEFNEWESEIKELFGEGIGYLPYVAIHLRVGTNPINPDEPKYMDNPFYYRLVESGYYINAINLFPDRKFLVFSDDIAFAKTYFEGDKFAFDDSENDIDAFNKMASCDSIIMANSSYSWWASYLCKNPSKKIVYPLRWFADDSKHVTMPSNWIGIL